MRTMRTTAAALVATLIVLLPSAAHADVLVRYDHGHDVRYFMIKDFEDLGSSPTRAIGDIIRMRVAHEGSAVRVSVQFRALPSAGKEHQHELRFRTPNGEWRVQVLARPGWWEGRSWLFDINDHWKTTCPAQTHQIDYANARLIVTVPRHCLRYPTFVKVGARTRVQGTDRYYFDDAQLDGGADTSFSLSPGVYR